MKNIHTLKMKRSIILIGLLLTGIVSLAQVIEISRFDKSYFQDLKSYELRGDLPNGSYRVYYDSLKTKLELTATITGGVKTGKWTWYFEDGNPKREVEYHMSQFNGTVKSWYPSGQISASSMYSMGLGHGENIRWHENGNKKSEGMTINGKPSGLWRYWKEDGSLLLEKNFQ